MIHYIRKNCGLTFEKKIPTTLYNGNSTCIVQLKGEYIKGDRIKRILSKFFFTHRLQKRKEIDV
jgi:hypothetical protein